MSIKNIIQQENDLQEMSTQSLANYLNNPTGQYNPYLVAGELQRKEAFAQRQMTEAPQGTVVDELVAKTMPMGGMPMGAPMGGMPMPRPEEVMVSDTITETGIANLPAPNIGQNYAGGGIVGYENGGEVSGAFEDELELVSEMATDEATLAQIGGSYLLKTLGVAKNTANLGGGLLAGLVYSPELGAAQLPREEFEAKMQAGQQNYAGGGIVGYKKGGALKKYAVKKADKIKDVYNKWKGARAQKKAAEVQKEALKKANQAGKPPAPAPTGFGSGPVSQGLKKAAKVGVPAAVKGVGKGVKYLGFTDPAVLGLGGLGYGGYKLYDKFLGEPARQKELEEKLAKEGRDSMEMHRQTRLRRESDERVQAELDAKQAAKDRQREKEMYLALALGGAKTMAGQSPFALSNVGEGLGAGVGALAAYDQNEMERVAASQAATLKAQQDMELALMDLDMKYRGQYVDLIETQEYLDFVKQVEQALEDGEIAPPKDGSMTGEQVKQAKINDFVQNRIGLAPRKSREARINNQLFQAME